MLAKFAEDDRIEQMNAQKRRMKQLEHKRAVEQLLTDRRAQFAAEREREIEERQEAAKMEAFKRQLIEEERQKLLRQHAQKLLGYLPKVRNGWCCFHFVRLKWKLCSLFIQLPDHMALNVECSPMDWGFSRSGANQSYEHWVAGWYSTYGTYVVILK